MRASVRAGGRARVRVCSVCGCVCDCFRSVYHLLMICPRLLGLEGLHL